MRGDVFRFDGKATKVETAVSPRASLLTVQ
jgi:hypothetical protein